jgi:hypothetical protein
VKNKFPLFVNFRTEIFAKMKINFHKILWQAGLHDWRFQKNNRIFTWVCVPMIYALLGIIRQKKTGGRRCHLLLSKRWHLFPPFLSKTNPAHVYCENMNVNQSPQLKTSECHSNWGGGNGLINQSKSAVCPPHPLSHTIDM